MRTEITNQGAPSSRLGHLCLEPALTDSHGTWDLGGDYLWLTGQVLLVMNLQDPDGGNNADEEQKHGRGIPGEHPTQHLATRW